MKIRSALLGLASLTAITAAVAPGAFAQRADAPQDYGLSTQAIPTDHIKSLKVAEGSGVIAHDSHGYTRGNEVRIECYVNPELYNGGPVQAGLSKVRLVRLTEYVPNGRPIVSDYISNPVGGGGYNYNPIPLIQVAGLEGQRLAGNVKIITGADGDMRMDADVETIDNTKLGPDGKWHSSKEVTLGDFCAPAWSRTEVLDPAVDPKGKRTDKARFVFEGYGTEPSGQIQSQDHRAQPTQSGNAPRGDMRGAWGNSHKPRGPGQ